MKKLVLLQAFTDDSVSQIGDRRLFLAGYLNRAETWTAFSRAWKQVLQERPSIQYFKMSEANSLRGQFEDWQSKARDEKVVRLAAVVKQYGGISFQFSISVAENDEILKPYSPRGIGNAHFITNFAVVAGISQYVSQYDEQLQIEFIFDEQAGVDADVAAFFGVMKDNLPLNAQAIISGSPIFDSDKNALPLQAADLLAWHLRREHETYNFPHETLPMADYLRSDSLHMTQHIDSSIIEKWAFHHKKMTGIELTQGKSQWQKIRKEFATLSASGFFPINANKLQKIIFRFKLRMMSRRAARNATLREAAKRQASRKGF